jgi:hypothetical protein
MTINNYSVLGAKDGTKRECRHNKGNGGDNDGNEDGNGNKDDNTNNLQKYLNPLDWSMHKLNGEGRVIGGRHIKPIPYTGGNELFEVNMTAVEKNAMKDADGNICFHTIFDWLLPTSGMQNVPFIKFVLARMSNYMMHIIKNKGYKPRHNNHKMGSLSQQITLLNFLAVN